MTSRDERHPVLWGLVALVTVAAVIGVIFGGAALVGTRVLGLDGGSPAGAGTPGERDRLVLPSPSPSQSTPTAPGSATAAPTTRPSRAPRPIQLIAGPERVASFGRIDLSGTYPRGEGAVLEVQRREGDTWTDFYSVTAVVTGGEFDTVVQTSRTGVNVFRVVDSDSGRASNPVRVRVG